MVDYQLLRIPAPVPFNFQNRIMGISKKATKNLAACAKSDIIRLRVQMTAVKQYSIFSKEETP
jgi:hypothetical protein